MPIPLSVTNPKGVGLAAANPAELPTQGPFARLGDSSDAQVSNSENGAVQQQHQEAADQAATCATSPPEVFAVETHGLNFWYPDIGGWRGLAGWLWTACHASSCMHISSWQPEKYQVYLPQNTNFTYLLCADGRPVPGTAPVVQEMSIQLPKGATCLLIGPNGAGKTTLLKVAPPLFIGAACVPSTALTVGPHSQPDCYYLVALSATSLHHCVPRPLRQGVHHGPHSSLCNLTNL